MAKGADAQLSIGHLAAAGGCAVETVRHYESIGLLAPAFRTSGNQRRYDQATLRRLGFIRHARDLGLSLADIRQLLAIADCPDQPCADADAVIAGEIRRVDEQIARLTALKSAFEQMLHACGGGAAAECGVLTALDAEAGR